MDYPTIDPKTMIPIRIIEGNLLSDPEYLSHPECPYSPDMKSLLERLVGGSIAVPNLADLVDLAENPQWDGVDGEAEKLYMDLASFKLRFKEGDVAERMAYFRTATALLDKIALIRERGEKIKLVSEFQKNVLAVFEEVLSPDQRTTVLERFRDFC